MLGAFTWHDGVDAALAFFLVVVGLLLGWALFMLAGMFMRVSWLLRGVESELLPVISKVGGSVDRVNAQLDKVDQVTTSAVDAVDAVDHTVRIVSVGVRRPVEALSGLAAGVAHGFATLRTRRDWRAALESAREASGRRRADIADELRDLDG